MEVEASPASRTIKATEVKLTDEEKLLLAQEKRGKTIPSKERQRELLEKPTSPVISGLRPWPSTLKEKVIGGPR